MKYTQLRHATGLLNYGGKEILIDPMLAPKESAPPIPNSWNDRRNPMIDLPFDLQDFEPPKYCLVTHLHRDHFDDFAASHLPKSIKLICQSEDADSFESLGFINITPIENSVIVDGIQITRVEGQHGTGQTAAAMGSSPGYILSAEGESVLYMTGDTIFYNKVEETLKRHQPEVLLAFAGNAQFSESFLTPGPITLSPEHLLSIHQTLPNAKIICTHMDTINHCKTTRADLKVFIENASVNRAAFFIPADGETVTL